MEEKFIAAWAAARENAAKHNVRMRPVAAEEAMKQAHRCLSGRRLSDGFNFWKRAMLSAKTGFSQKHHTVYLFPAPTTTGCGRCYFVNWHFI